MLLIFQVSSEFRHHLWFVHLYFCLLKSEESVFAVRKIFISIASFCFHWIFRNRKKVQQWDWFQSFRPRNRCSIFIIISIIRPYGSIFGPNTIARRQLRIQITVYCCGNHMVPGEWPICILHISNGLVIKKKMPLQILPLFFYDLFKNK